MPDDTEETPPESESTPEESIAEESAAIADESSGETGDLAALVSQLAERVASLESHQHDYGETYATREHIHDGGIPDATVDITATPEEDTPPKREHFFFRKVGS